MLLATQVSSTAGEAGGRPGDSVADPPEFRPRPGQQALFVAQGTELRSLRSPPNGFPVGTPQAQQPYDTRKSNFLLGEEPAAPVRLERAWLKVLDSGHASRNQIGALAP